jgi:trans-aconitate methyltransferase
MTAAASVISFNPALFIQRQAFLLDALRQQKPKSVLDVGCGEGRLLECLARCEDDLPVELLAGIDVSLPVLREASRGIEMSANQQQEDGRWRPLQVLLLEGLSYNAGTQAETKGNSQN